jgi:hypothetical protein
MRKRGPGTGVAPSLSRYAARYAVRTTKGDEQCP